jgi:hypothetical protein
VATAWVIGPRYTEQDREHLKSQGNAFNLSIDDLVGDLDEPTQDTLEIAPENITAFYWFVDVDADGFWEHINGYRHCLDIKTILIDADITERDFKADDYKKLKLLGRFAVSAELKAQAKKHGE